MFNLTEIQTALQNFKIDGWLLYDFRGSNVLAQRVLGIENDAAGSRRYLYCIPAKGEPVKLVHRIESGTLDHLPGEKIVYLKWQELEKGIQQLLGEMKIIAMEYSPGVTNPYVSKVDAGTLEFVRAQGVKVVSSGDLVQLFEATLNDAMWQYHLQAAKLTDTAFEIAWQTIAEGVNDAGQVEESTVEEAIMNHFTENNMTTYHPPIVAVNENSGDPHYETGTGNNTLIKKGDFVLIDLWAKIDHPDGIYSDHTRVGFVGDDIPEVHSKIFNIVGAARDAGIAAVENAYEKKRPIQGWEVDQATRDVIEEAGYGEFFVHRTGHSIGRETHGNGANIDNLETKEERQILPRTLFSIEPGIYQPEFGVRCEVDVFVDTDGKVHVTGGERQTEIHAIL